MGISEDNVKVTGNSFEVRASIDRQITEQCVHKEVINRLSKSNCLSNELAEARIPCRRQEGIIYATLPP